MQLEVIGFAVSFLYNAHIPLARRVEVYDVAHTVAEFISIYPYIHDVEEVEDVACSVVI